ncbi:hypothetical protein [uncultured Roseibium sp.]|uniref:hypothetical protein n=1 Tax=uncultured Roseibium sp. TaxID=1936171 RepID=UPI00262349C1|nr:hypothetical protein [uncultured Roseibium sp.]
MSNKPTHDVCLVEENGDKAFFTNVGSAWLKDTGTISVEIRPNLSVSGRLVVSQFEIWPNFSLQPVS